MFRELFRYTLFREGVDDSRTPPFNNAVVMYQAFLKMFPHLKLSQEEFDTVIFPVLLEVHDSLDRCSDVRPLGTLTQTMFPVRDPETNKVIDTRVKVRKTGY
jgi:hypothetical protein